MKILLLPLEFSTFAFHCFISLNFLLRFVAPFFSFFGTPPCYRGAHFSHFHSRSLSSPSACFPVVCREINDRHEGEVDIVV